MKIFRLYVLWISYTSIFNAQKLIHYTNCITFILDRKIPLWMCGTHIKIKENKEPFFLPPKQAIVLLNSKKLSKTTILLKIN